MDNFDGLLKSQKWLEETIKEACNGVKKDAKDRILRFKQDLDDYNIKLRHYQDPSGSKDTTMSMRNYFSKGLDNSNEIHSKEFSRTGEDNDYVSQGNSRILYLSLLKRANLSILKSVY